MIKTVSDLKRLDNKGQAREFFSRRRRLSLQNSPRLFRTHAFPIPTATIDTDVVFPDRTQVITLLTTIRILPNAGIHRGIVWEFGGATHGAFVYVNDSVIGCVVGGITSGVTAANGEFSFGGEIPVNLQLTLILSIKTTTGEIRLWNGGKLLIKTQASNGFPSASWTAIGDGSFAAAPSDAAHPLVPLAARITPNGFVVVSQLSIYNNQLRR